jgi:hypothetical protein
VSWRYFSASSSGGPYWRCGTIETFITDDLYKPHTFGEIKKLVAPQVAATLAYKKLRLAVLVHPGGDLEVTGVLREAERLSKTTLHPGVQGGEGVAS